MLVSVGSAAARLPEFGHKVASGWLVEVEYVLLTPVWGPIRVLAQRRGLNHLCATGRLLILLVSFRTVKGTFYLVLCLEYLVGLLLKLLCCCEACHILLTINIF